MEVERSLLQILRDDAEKNPWNRVFVQNDLKVGKRGFKRKGYHEKNLEEEMEAERRKQCHSQAVTKRKFEVLTTEPHVEEEGSQVRKLSVNLSASSSTTASTTCLSREGSFSSSSMQSSEMHFPCVSSVPQPFYVPDFVQNPWQAYMNVWNKLVPPKQRRAILDAATERGVKVNTPAMYYMLNQPVNRNDLQFTWDFLLPPPEEQFMRPGKPVGTLVVSGSWVILAEDEIAVQIMAGSSVNKHMYQLFGSLVSAVFSHIKLMPLVAQGMKSIWRRSVFMKHDGTLTVLLIQLLLSSEKLMFIQDQGVKFQNLLETPHLF